MSSPDTPDERPAATPPSIDILSDRVILSYHPANGPARRVVFTFQEGDTWHRRTERRADDRWVEEGREDITTLSITLGQP